MPYTSYIPTSAVNVNWTGAYAVLSPANLATQTARFLYNDSNGVMSWLQPNVASGVVQLDNTGKIPTNLYVTSFLSLTGNNPSTSPMTGNFYMGNNIISGASAVLLGTLSHNTTNSTIDVTNSINFNDATASNRNVSGVNTITATTLNSTTLSNTGAITVQSNASTYVKVQNTGNYIEIQANTGPIYINGGNYAGGTNGNYTHSTSNDHSISAASTMTLTGATVSVVTANLLFPSLPTGTGTDLVLNGSVLVRNTSSMRYKDNIQPLQVDTTKVYDLTPKSFKYIGQSKQIFGMIAEEVFEIIPELVNLNAEGLPESISYSLLSVLLLDEVKKLRSELNDVKTRLSNANI